jgi:hypothetical protein
VVSICFCGERTLHLGEPFGQESCPVFLQCPHGFSYLVLDVTIKLPILGNSYKMESYGICSSVFYFT